MAITAKKIQQNFGRNFCRNPKANQRLLNQHNYHYSSSSSMRYPLPSPRYPLPALAVTFIAISCDKENFKAIFLPFVPSSLC